MYPTVRGYKITFHATDQYHNTHTDAIILPFTAAATEEEAIPLAVDAARNGYLDWPIEVTQIDTGRWCPTGGWANPTHTALWVN